MRYHRLTAGQLAALASGSGDRPAIEELTARRVRHGVLLLRHLTDVWVDDRAPLEAAVALLTRAQAARPPVYRHLLSDPMVSAWLERVARDDVPPRGELLQVGGLAAAAAIRAGVEG